MEYIQQDISYLRGFLAGDSSIEGQQQQVYDRMLSVIENLTDEMKQLRLRLTELEEYVEAVDEDLNDVEQMVFEEEMDDLMQIVCPACEEEVWVEREDLRDPSVECLCPNCQAILLEREPRENLKEEYEKQETI